MAYDKVVDSAQLDGALTSMADAIRGKTGESSPIAWDAGNGFAAAIAAIVSGGSGLAVESGEYIPSVDTRTPDIEVSQAAHDGCLLMMLTVDDDDLPVIQGIENSLRAMYEVCSSPFYFGEINGFHCYSATRLMEKDSSSPSASAGMNNYSGGPSVEGSTIRFSVAYALGWLRAGVTYHWQVYYRKEAGV